MAQVLLNSHGSGGIMHRRDTFLKHRRTNWKPKDPIHSIQKQITLFQENNIQLDYVGELLLNLHTFRNKPALMENG